MEEIKNNAKSLNHYLEQARLSHTALGHFNFATADVLRGIVEASKEANAPAVMVGTSEGESDFMGIEEAVALVGAMREDFNFPIFLNADHFKSFEKCKEAMLPVLFKNRFKRHVALGISCAVIGLHEKRSC